MTKRAKGTFAIASWNEDTIAALGPGAKLTEAKVTQKFTGDLEGEGSVIWVMCYVSEKYARFVGMQRATGSLGGRSGGFVMETAGTFDGGIAKARWSIIPGSGTDGLSGISGTGSFEAPHGPTATYEIEYGIEVMPAG